MAAIKIENAHKIIPAMRRGIASALNKTMAKAQTAASKQVRTVYNIKAGDLKRKIRVSKAHINKSRAGFSVRGQRLTLNRFAARDEYPRGVSFKIKKTSGRKRLPHAFARLIKGRVQVLGRVGKERYPLQIFKTVGPVKMYEKEGEKAVEKSINENFHNLMQHEVEFKLSKL